MTASVLTLQYIAFRVANNEVFVATRRAAMNMAHQDITVKTGEIDVVATLTGQVCEYIQVCAHSNCQMLYILCFLPTW